MYQITDNTANGILFGMAGEELEKQAFLGAIGKGLGWAIKAPFRAGWWAGKQTIGRGAKALGITPAGAGISALFAAPVGISAASGAMPQGGFKRAVFGPAQRRTLSEPVKSPQSSLF